MHGEYRAVIFDLNGTILDDEDEYALAFKKVLEGSGVKLSKNFSHIVGIGVRENIILMLKKFKIQHQSDPKLLTTKVQREYLRLFDSSVQLRSGVLGYIDNLKEGGIKIGLATSNNRSVLDSVFKKFNIERLFDQITTADDVKKNKPDPELFIKTAQKLSIEPSKCLVYEDSQAGIDAARKAGMRVIGVDNGLKNCILDVENIIKDFTQVEHLS